MTDDADLTTRALVFAFWAFRNELYKDIENRSSYCLSKMAFKWIGQKELKKGNVEVARVWL
jgi:hypothetical protein